MNLAPDTSSSIEKAVGATSVKFGASMGASADVWMFVSTVDCWIAQGANPTASAGAGSMFVPAKVIIQITGRAGADLAVVEDSTAGKASLTRALRP